MFLLKCRSNSPARERTHRTVVQQAERRLITAESGAAYVEFLIAFFPILILFVGLLQLQLVYLTSLFVQRAAFAGARAAAVYIPQPNPEDGRITHEITKTALTAVEQAVLLSVAPVMLRGWLSDLPFVTFPASPDPRSDAERESFEDGTNMVRVRVYAFYVCHLPPVDTIMCRNIDGKRRILLWADGAFPYQRAEYQRDIEKDNNEDDDARDFEGPRPRGGGG
jgi:hypothetical protein